MIDECPCCGTEIRKYKGTFIPGPNYIISQNNRTVTKYGSSAWNANAIGSEAIPLGTITLINFKIEKTLSSNFMFGIAPQSIDQNITIGYKSCGWYYHSQNGGLYCQPPLSYNNFKFRNDSYLPDKTIITIIVDTKIGKVSYKINGSKPKAAYHLTFPENIVPCVGLYDNGDSISIFQE